MFGGHSGPDDEPGGSGLVGRLTRVNRFVAFAVVGLVLALFAGFAAWFFLLREDVEKDGEGGGGGVQAAFSEPAVSAGPVGPDGGLLPEQRDERIALMVAATVEAMATPVPPPTPTPTPDIAATLQAELARNRELAPPVVLLNPLDLETDRDPYLTPGELDYFWKLGPRLWVYTQVWLHVQKVLSVDSSEWNSDLLGYDVEVARELLGSAPERPMLSSSGDVDPLVQAYADSVESGMARVGEAVSRLSEAVEILAGEEVGHPEREELLRASRDVEGLLAGFDEAMSAYSCSVCGELFRRGEGQP
jgi:hypothetical protein